MLYHSESNTVWPNATLINLTNIMLCEKVSSRRLYAIQICFYAPQNQIFYRYISENFIFLKKARDIRHKIQTMVTSRARVPNPLGTQMHRGEQPARE